MGRFESPPRAPDFGPRGRCGGGGGRKSKSKGRVQCSLGWELAPCACKQPRWSPRRRWGAWASASASVWRARASLGSTGEPGGEAEFGEASSVPLTTTDTPLSYLCLSPLRSLSTPPFFSPHLRKRSSSSVLHAPLISTPSDIRASGKGPREAVEGERGQGGGEKKKRPLGACSLFVPLGGDARTDCRRGQVESGTECRV